MFGFTPVAATYRSACRSVPSARRTPSAAVVPSKAVASTPSRTATPRATMTASAIAAVSGSSMRGISQPRRPMIVTATPRSARSRAISIPMNPAPTMRAERASLRRTRPMSTSAVVSDLKSWTPGRSQPGTGACSRLPEATTSAS